MPIPSTYEEGDSRIGMAFCCRPCAIADAIKRGEACTAERIDALRGEYLTRRALVPASLDHPDDHRRAWWQAQPLYEALRLALPSDAELPGEPD